MEGGQVRSRIKLHLKYLRLIAGKSRKRGCHLSSTVVVIKQPRLPATGSLSDE